MVVRFFFLCDPCARVRPCVVCPVCVARLPPVSFYRYCTVLSFKNIGGSRDTRDRHTVHYTEPGATSRNSIITWNHQPDMPIAHLLTSAPRDRRCWSRPSSKTPGEPGHTRDGKTDHTNVTGKVDRSGTIPGIAR